WGARAVSPAPESGSRPSPPPTWSGSGSPPAGGASASSSTSHSRPRGRWRTRPHGRATAATSAAPRRGGGCRAGAAPAASSERRGWPRGRETGPSACLLYPFEPAAHGWTLAVERSGSVELAARSGEPRCLAAEETRSRGSLLRSFALDVEGLTALIDRLRAEV